MNKENSSGVPSDSVSGVGQTASIGKSTSVSSGAAKVFREFKWGLLTLFLLMVVVVGLVYDGGTRKKTALAPKAPESALDINIDGPTHATPPAAPGAGDPLLGPVTGTDPLPNGNGSQPGGPVAEFGAPPSIPPTPTNPGYTPPAPPTYSTPPATQFNDRGSNFVSTPPAPPAPTNPVTPTSPVPPSTETAAKTYKVQSGDTLSSIAQSMKLGKGGVKALIAANKNTLPDPNRLKVGMTLNVPSPAATTAVTPPTPGAPDTKKVTMAESTPKLDATTPATPGDYTVQSGDTLERIARKVFNDGRRWQDIHNWNRDQLPDPARLRVGQVLKIKQNAKTSTPKSKISEAEALPNEGKAAVAETPLLVPNVEKEIAPVKESKKKIATAEKHDEPKVEVMSAMSSAFAP